MEDRISSGGVERMTLERVADILSEESSKELGGEQMPTGMTREEVHQIATATADEVMSRIREQEKDRGLRDLVIGCTIGEGAIPLRGRETRKAPCHGCRIDPGKPLEPGNVMVTTEGAIGTLSAREVRDWCSEITEDPDGRCERVRAIRKAARECKEKYPDDTAKFFGCYAPAFAGITK